MRPVFGRACTQESVPVFPKTRKVVTAAFPSDFEFSHRPFSRWLIRVSTLLILLFQFPLTIAQYSLRIRFFSNNYDKARFHFEFFANKTTPVVSRSSRCKARARAPAYPLTWISSERSSPSTRSPLGLSIASKSGSSNTMFSGPFTTERKLAD